MRKIIAIAALLVLAACGPSEDERRAAFMSNCVPAFTPPQCVVLFGIKEDVRSAEASSSAAAAMSGAAVGMSAGRR